MKTYQEALQDCRAKIEELEAYLAMRKEHGEENGFLAGRLRERLAEAEARLAALQAQGEAAYTEEQLRQQRLAGDRLARNWARHEAVWSGVITTEEFFREIE